MARKFDMLKDIDNSKQLWKVAVRIVDVWWVPPKPPQPEHFELVLMDAKGDKIQLSLYKDELVKWKSKLKENSTYIIHYFKVVSNDLQYKACDHPYRIYFIGGTIVKELHLAEIPTYEYQFKNFADILAGNFRTDLLVEIIGTVHQVSYSQPTGDQKKFAFTIRDFSGELIGCTLWDDYAMKMMTYKEKAKSEQIIFILTHARIKPPEGKYPVSISNSWYGSKLLINEDIPEIESYKNRFAAMNLPEPSTQRLSQFSAASQFSQRERFMYKAEVKPIADINRITEEVTCVTVGTTGDFVVSKNGWSYQGCMSCTRRANVPHVPYKCECGNVNEHSIPRYKLEINVYHNNHGSKFIFWNQDCYDLIGNSALELRQRMIEEGEDEPNVYPEPLDRMLNKTSALKVRVQPSYSQSSVIKAFDDAELVQSILNQFESQEETSKLDKGKSLASEDLQFETEISNLDKGKSLVSEELRFETQSLSGTADHDPDLAAAITPAKRLSSEMQFDDHQSQELVSAQMSSTKILRSIKSE